MINSLNLPCRGRPGKGGVVVGGKSYTCLSTKQLEHEIDQADLTPASILLVTAFWWFVVVLRSAAVSESPAILSLSMAVAPFGSGPGAAPGVGGVGPRLIVDHVALRRQR